MSNLPLWSNLCVILVALRLTVMGSLRLAEAAFVDERDRAEHQATERWLPLRMSNSVILLGATFCVMICVQHPPFGSLFELFLGTLATLAAPFFPPGGIEGEVAGRMKNDVDSFDRPDGRPDCAARPGRDAEAGVRRL